MYSFHKFLEELYLNTKIPFIVVLDDKKFVLSDFDNCDKVAPKEYSAKMTEKGFEIDLPKCSVVVVTMR